MPVPKPKPMPRPQSGRPQYTLPPRFAQNSSPNAHRVQSKLELEKKKKHKRRVVFVAFIGVLVTVLGIISVVLTYAQQKNPRTTVPTNTNQPIIITVWTHTADEVAMRNLAEEFQAENPGVYVNFVDRLDVDYKEILEARLLQGDPNVLPDIIEIDEGWLDEYSYYFQALPEDPLILSRYPETLINNNRDEFGVKGIPFNFDSLVLAYNRAHLAELELDESDFITLDWPFLIDRADRLTQRQEITVNNRPTIQINRSGMAVGSPEVVTNAASILKLLLVQNDTRVYSSSNATYATSKGLEDMIRFYSEFQSRKIWDDTLGNDIEAFKAGKVSMILVRSNDIKSILETAPGLDFATVFPAKVGSIRNISISTSLAIPYTTPNYSAAYAFLEFISRPEKGTRLFEAQRYEAFVPAQIESQKAIPDNSPYSIFSDISPTSIRFVSSNQELASEGIEKYLINFYRVNQGNFASGGGVDINASSLIDSLKKILPTPIPLPTNPSGYFYKKEKSLVI